MCEHDFALIKIQNGNGNGNRFAGKKDELHHRNTESTNVDEIIRLINETNYVRSEPTNRKRRINVLSWSTSDKVSRRFFCFFFVFVYFFERKLFDFMNRTYWMLTTMLEFIFYFHIIVMTFRIHHVTKSLFISSFSFWMDVQMNKSKATWTRCFSMCLWFFNQTSFNQNRTMRNLLNTTSRNDFCPKFICFIVYLAVILVVFIVFSQLH